VSGERRGKALLAPADLLEFKAHTRRKLNVHEKYLRQCIKFANFCYVDTHGGTGLIKINEQVIEGSAVKAAEISPSTPIYVIEVDPHKVQRLRLVAKEKNLSLLNIIEGDCNIEVPILLKEEIEPGQRFILFFVDPDSYIYRESGQRILEFSPLLFDTITMFPRSEILFTLILQGTRVGSYCFKRPFDPKAPAMGKALEATLGTGIIQWLETNQLYRLHHLLLEWFLSKYIKTQPRHRYKYAGALLINSSRGVPQYYLVFGTNNQTGAEIMRNVMKTEWKNQSGQTEVITPPLDLFVFDDRLMSPRLLDILKN